MDYTFAQPVKGGYYYIVVRADSIEEATAKAEDAMKNVEHKQRLTEPPLGSVHPEGLVRLGIYLEGTVVLKPTMKEELEKSGVAHSFMQRKLPPLPGQLP